MTRSPTWLALAALVAMAGAAPSWGFEGAGASTFSSGARLYHHEIPPLQDIPVPHVEVAAPEHAPGKHGAKAKPAGQTFEIQRFEVRGNSLLLPSQIDGTLRPFVGKDKGIDDVQAARDALQNLYVKEGFITVAVTIPQQTVSAGTIRLQVIEARLGKVVIHNPGFHWYSNQVVEERTPHLESGAILRREDVQVDLRRANRNPDLRVRPVLKPGKKPGTVDLVLEVHERIPLHGSLEIDNDHPPGSPPRRAQAEVSYGNLWDLGHQVSLFYQTSISHRPSDVQIYGATYRAPMPWSEGQSLFGYIVKSDTTNTVVTAPGLTLLGKGLNMGLRYQVTLPEIDDLPWLHHSLTFGIDRKDVENDLQQGQILIPHPITYLPMSVAYDLGLDLQQSRTLFNAGLHFNRAGLVAGGSKQDFQDNRGGISPSNPVDGNYELLRFNLDETVRAPAFLRTLAAGRFISLPAPDSPSFADDWTIHVVARGQWASQPLIPTEQFAAGGVDSVRGYLQSEEFGDNAWNAQIEVRTPFWRPRFRGTALPGRFQLVGFFDAARLYTKNPQEGQRAIADIQGIGVGLRASLFDHLTAELYAGYPMLRTVYTNRDVRLNFQVSAGF